MEKVFGSAKTLYQVQAVLGVMLIKRSIPFSIYSASKKEKGSWVNLIGAEGTKELAKQRLELHHPLACSEHEMEATGILFATMVNCGYAIDSLLQLPVSEYGNH